MSHMRVPELRRRLDALADRTVNAVDAEELRLLSRSTHQNPMSRPRAENASTPITDEVALEIRLYADSHPSLAQHRVASHFNVNQGQVSSILSGGL